MGIIIKTKEQIDGIRKSCALAAATLRFVGTHVKEGISTEKLNEVAETYIRDHGAIPAPLNYQGFPKSICTSINEVICHGIPSESTILNSGDIINIDITTILDGYYGDTSTMFAVGEISEQASRLLKITQNCLSIGIDRVKPDREFYKISKAITDYASKHGFSVVYKFCGHGTGLQFHEEPQINHYFHPQIQQETRKMKPGMIFTIEPMICAGSSELVILEDKWTAVTCDGSLSAQYEHTVLVTNNGCEILTQ